MAEEDCRHSGRRCGLRGFVICERHTTDPMSPAFVTRRWVTLGVVLTAGSAAGVAAWGITGPDAVIHRSFPGAAVVGAAILGALPRRKKS